MKIVDYAVELRNVAFGSGGLTDNGLIEFEADLFRGTTDELGICAYAASAAELTHEVLPILQNALRQLEHLKAAVPDDDADLAIVTLYEGRLGLTFWERTVNNEFVAIFSPDSTTLTGWRYDGLGDLFEP
ncbi:hypothetical protein AB1K56_09035 [Microbacterium sp. BWR-S6Y]|uniref:hypothetical protein n=1 Tax=Microbacterium sp. BWR-S6Y TaxID=3232073 RepID=UPI00352879B7